jgi:antitoxin PrlF
MATRVTIKGQVTLPKAVREAVGIRPGDVVIVRARAEGGIIVERQAPPEDDAEYLKRLQDIAARRPMLTGPYGDMSTDAIMDILRGDD